MVDKKNGWKINIPTDINKPASLSSSYLRPLAVHNTSSRSTSKSKQRSKKK